MEKSMALPLDGIRIVDFSRLLPGPFCTLLLGDLGAEVIKVEDTKGGDYARYYPPMVNESGAFFQAINRNKKSVSLNLKTSEGVEAAKRLVASADVVLESFRPGVMDRLGLGYEALSEADPNLVFCAISGFGATGPLKDRAGHDLTYMALSGMLHQNGSAAAGPQVPGFQLADIAGGALYAALGIVTALYARERGQGGQFLDISMTEGALSFALPSLASAVVEPSSVEQGGGMLTGGIAAYNVYETKDGRHFAVSPLEPKFWAGFVAAVGAPELIGEGHGPEEGKVKVAEIMRSKTFEEWTEVFAALDVCVEPIYGPLEVLEHELHKARNCFFQLAGVQQVRTPLTPEREHTPAPGLGEHTGEILVSLGFSESELANLAEVGAITA